MNREDIVEFLNAGIIYLDNGIPEEYGLNKELSDMARKLINYLKLYEVKCNT